MTYPQYLVLLALWDDGSLSVGDLARRLDLDAAAVSPLLKRLVAAGLVSRRRDGSDERVVRVYPTSQVDALRGALAEVQSRVDCSTGVAPAEFSQLRETLNRLTQTMAIDREPGRELTG